MARRTPADLRHDTPVDVPVSAIRRSVGLQTIEWSYRAWEEARAAQKSAESTWLTERAQLESEGALLLGSVRAAGDLVSAEEPSIRLAALQTFVDETRAKIAAAIDGLDQKRRVDEALHTQQIAEAQQTIEGHLERQLGVVRPRWEVAVRRQADDRRIVHVLRLSDDEAVLSLLVLNERIPSRYAFLGDDSTDDVCAGPPMLYPDDGVQDVRPDAIELGRALDARPKIWPVKGMIPMRLSDGRWLVWRSRGVVMEAEVQEAAAFRNLLTAAESETIVGQLLKFHLLGRLTLELVRE